MKEGNNMKQKLSTKQIVLYSIALLVVVLCISVSAYHSDRYSTTVMVYEIENTTAKGEDENGNLFDFYNQDYKVGDEVLLEVNSNHTIRNSDDEVVASKLVD